MSHNNNTAPDLKQIVALSMPLQGIHLIEASAGTGKTWTLSVYLVRLIIEKHYQTRQIIVTTFTRAAAAELKQRIREDIQKAKQWLLQGAQAAPNEPLAQYIFSHLDAEQRAHGLHLLQLALDTFDELFVGTLDSFCQKILHEFAFESGQYERLVISEQAQTIQQQIIHDSIRQWRVQQDPRLIDMLLLSDKLLDVDALNKVANESLNFLSAQLQPEVPVSIDIEQWQTLAAQLESIDFTALDEFLHPDGVHFKALNSKKRFCSKASAYPDVITQLAAQLRARQGVLSLAQDDQAWFEGFDKLDGLFKKGFEAAEKQFLQLEATQLLLKINALIKQQQADFDSINRQLTQQVIINLREQLPSKLMALGETTFSQQMRLLSQALQSESGRALAQHIVHRYPAVMVDEFQDTNADQDQVIASIWRQAELVDSVCLVMVGDPKQSIYGFRGGDVLTYQKAKQAVLNLGKQHCLSQNQRSIAPLVAAVDGLFARHPDFGEQVEYQSVVASGRNTQQLVEQVDGQAVSNAYPLRLVELTQGQSEYQQTAWQVIQLLAQSSQQQLQLKDAEQTRAIEPQDIAVLCFKNAELDEVHYFLEQANVPVWRGSNRSVFESILAHDVAAVLQAMLHPQHEGYLRRALASQLVGLTVADFNHMDQDDDLLSQYQQQFAALGERWLKRGFLFAWQQFLRDFSVWITLANKAHSERAVVNLRHLVELLHQHSDKVTGQHHLLAWLMQQISAAPKQEADLERRMAGEQGVQLMTIHKSKGLEFPIVFVAGIDKDKRPKKHKATVVYAEKEQQRILGLNVNDEVQWQQHLARTQAENCRVAYVALTRASLRLYLMVNVDDQPKNKKTAPKYPHYVLRYWLNTPRDTWSDTHTVLQPSMTTAPDFEYSSQHTVTEIAAQALPDMSVRYWSQSSFSQLVTHGHSPAPTDNHDADTALAEAAAADDELSEPSMTQAAHAVEVEDVEPTDKIALLDDPALNDPAQMQFEFPRGANAGNCLHDILEFLPVESDQTAWQACIEQRIQRYGMAAAYAEYHQGHSMNNAHVLYWIQQIMQAQLPAQAQLIGLHNQVHELQFFLGLSDNSLDVTAVQQLLQQHGVSVSALNVAHTVKYLKGFIDLVYAHEGKYYIADYKSNHLGAQLSDYSPACLEQSMSKEGYWLQAAIYMLALHRYLGMRLRDYQPEQHLGGAVYLYLRGMQAGSNQTGVLHWQPDVSLVLALDRLFGYSNTRHAQLA